MKKETVRLNFEFPREHYPDLKKICAEKQMTFKEFASRLLIQAIEDYEDALLAKQGQKRLDEMNPDETISFDEAVRLSGWEDDKDLRG